MINASRKNHSWHVWPGRLRILNINLQHSRRWFCASCSKSYPFPLKQHNYLHTNTKNIRWYLIFVTLPFSTIISMSKFYVEIISEHQFSHFENIARGHVFIIFYSFHKVHTSNTSRHWQQKLVENEAASCLFQKGNNFIQISEMKVDAAFDLRAGHMLQPQYYLLTGPMSLIAMLYHSRLLTVN